MFKKLFKMVVCEVSDSCKSKSTKKCHTCTRNEVLGCKDNYQKEKKCNKSHISQKEYYANITNK